MFRKWYSDKKDTENFVNENKEKLSVKVGVGKVKRF